MESRRALWHYHGNVEGRGEARARRRHVLLTNQLNAVVTQRSEVAPGLLILRVAPDGWSLPAFKPGQFAVLGLPAEASRHPLSDLEDPPAKPGSMVRRSYSIASSSRENEYLEFFLNFVRSGSLTPRLFSLGLGDRVWLGPKITGLFTFDQVPPGANVVMVGTGTGLAPYMSMLRTFLDQQQRRLAVIHGARHSWDLAYRAELVTMQRLRPNLAYFATVSRPDEEPVPWGGEVGRVQDVWLRRRVGGAWGVEPSPADTHLLLCGNPTMIGDMVALLASEGYSEHTRQQPGHVHVERYW
jgi:ferredoxin--NADP+ reductase